uniref:C2 domain-containing protein n=1 Tax=Monodon monoceros TaxID=40151 RepID=A0A8C6C3V0_MONMO
MGEEDPPGAVSLPPHGCPGDGEGPRERGPQAAAAPTAATATPREDSAAQRLERRVRCVSTCLSDYSLASDSGVFEPPTERSEDADKPARGDACSNEGPQIHVGFLHDSASECLLVNVLQLKNFARLVVKEDCKIHICVCLPPLDPGTPNMFCSKALELKAPLVFNEVFRIPVHSSMVTLKSLQLYVCSVNPQLQEELLGIGQINLADYDGSSEMQLRWYSVQVFTGPEAPWREDERLVHSDSRDPAMPLYVFPGAACGSWLLPCPPSGVGKPTWWTVAVAAAPRPAPCTQSPAALVSAPSTDTRLLARQTLTAWRNFSPHL